MHTTLYRSLALLVSIFALTSSFSLSTDTKSRQDSMSNSQESGIDDTPNEIHIVNKTHPQPLLDNTTGTKGQHTWIFEYVWGNKLSQFRGLEDNKSVQSDPDHTLKKIVTRHLDNNGLNGIHSAFRIYKKGNEKKQIIGIVFKTYETENEGNLYLYNYYEKKMRLLFTKYNKKIREREVDLSCNTSFTFNSYKKDHYVLRVKWKGFAQIYRNIIVSCDTEGNLQMTDDTGLIKIAGVCLFIIGLAIYVIYSKGYCSFLSKKSR